MALQVIQGYDALPTAKDKINYNFAQFTVNGGVVLSSLNALSDVSITGVQDGQILQYDSLTGQFKNVDYASNLDIIKLSVMGVI